MTNHRAACNKLRRQWLLLALALAVLTGIAAGDEAPARPNILWLTAEDLSPQLGCYGDPVAHTPNFLDQLAAAGHRYTHAFATYGVCAPARHSIITGMYPVSTGAMGMRTFKRSSAIADRHDPRFDAIPIYVKSK